jgi:putative DNA primase/helicase
MSDPTEQFREAIARAGITPPPSITADGRLHRFPANGKPRDMAAWYVFHPDGLPAGAFGNWRDGTSETWHAQRGRELTAAERESHRQRVAAMAQERRAAEEAARAAAARSAVAEWAAAEPATEHPYLSAKAIKPHGARVQGGRLVIPIHIGAELVSLQFIAADGQKRFLPDGRTRGGHYLIGTPGDVLCIAEGFATAASVHEATGYSVVVAFNAGNLAPVAEAMRHRFPAARIILCADNDTETAGNPGLTKATAAAQAIRGCVASPPAGDFNDMARAAGLDAVRSIIDAATAQNPVEAPAGSDAWPELEPLAASESALPYPLAALPPLLREAVAEVQGFTQAPLALVANAALASLAVAGQGLADVERAPKLSGPCGLFLLTVAESGERKTSADGLFLDPVRAWERQQREAMAPELADYRSALASFEAVQDGFKTRLKQLAKSGKSTTEAAATLRDHATLRPVAPRVPRLLRVDATPEALAYGLAREWPAAGIITSEGGLFLGAHGMGRESVMRNLSLQNTLWDGKPLPIDRRTAESFTVSGARLTIAVQAQAGALHEFNRQAPGLARGMGFWARFLPAWPESTQGTRLYREPPPYWPALEAYCRRLAALLDAMPAPNPAGELELPLLRLGMAARTEWQRFHDDVERELAPGGGLTDVRDVASKAADNVARVACLFHLLEHGASGEIGTASVGAAGRIVAWHLTEARRLFASVAVSPDVTRAVGLEEWLVARCRATASDTVATRDVQREGPYATRERSALDAAMAVLATAGRVRQETEGRQRRLRLHPELLA